MQCKLSSTPRSFRKGSESFMTARGFTFLTFNTKMCRLGSASTPFLEINMV